MNYRLLRSDEWSRLNEIVPDYAAPSPENALAAIAENEHGIQAILFLQLQFHMEPIKIANPRVNFKRLVSTLDSALSEHKGMTYFAFSETPKIERMAELCGMERTPYSVWRKEIQ